MKRLSVRIIKIITTNIILDITNIDLTIEDEITLE